MKARRVKRDVVRVRVREDQSPMFHIPGKAGGWFISLLWNYGEALDVPSGELQRLLAGSKGDILIARKLVGNDLRLLEEYRNDIDREVHARLIVADKTRWRRARAQRR